MPRLAAEIWGPNCSRKARTTCVYFQGAGLEIKLAFSNPEPPKIDYDYNHAMMPLNGEGEGIVAHLFGNWGRHWVDSLALRLKEVPPPPKKKGDAGCPGNRVLAAYSRSSLSPVNSVPSSRMEQLLVFSMFQARPVFAKSVDIFTQFPGTQLEMVDANLTTAAIPLTTVEREATHQDHLCPVSSLWLSKRRFEWMVDPDVTESQERGRRDKRERGREGGREGRKDRRIERGRDKREREIKREGGGREGRKEGQKDRKERKKKKGGRREGGREGRKDRRIKRGRDKREREIKREGGREGRKEGKEERRRKIRQH
ncbi:Octapeptide-repeat protein T2, partial [Ophiophagus hannah]